MENARIAIFASGTGSNAKALMNYFSSNEQIQIGCLISNKETCGAVDLAKSNGIDVGVFTNEDIDEGNLLLDFLSEKNITIIVLAGFLRKISKSIILTYPNRIINVHPSILPNFGGKGMYGKNVHQAVLQAKEKQSGITIHLVNENYDEGHYIAQFYTQVFSHDTISSLESRIQELEHRYFPYVVEGYVKSLNN